MDTGIVHDRLTVRIYKNRAGRQRRGQQILVIFGIWSPIGTLLRVPKPVLSHFAFLSTFGHSHFLRSKQHFSAKKCILTMRNSQFVDPCQIMNKGHDDFSIEIYVS